MNYFFSGFTIGVLVTVAIQKRAVLSVWAAAIADKFRKKPPTP